MEKKKVENFKPCSTKPLCFFNEEEIIAIDIRIGTKNKEKTELFNHQWFDTVTCNL